MQRLKSIVRASTIALAVTGILASPAFAAPSRIAGPTVTSNIVKVQEVGHETFRSGVRRRNGGYYYRHHRIYRHRRRGYRYYNGWWVPPAFFLGGLAVGGAIANGPRDYGSAHVRWCYRHYRSYREWDNTYQPYHGPRRQCVSPYY